MSRALLSSVSFAPWPIDTIRERLLQERKLHDLCGSRVNDDGFDVREHLLEDLARDAVIDAMAVDRLAERVELRRTLGVASTAFPFRSRPDIVVQLGRSFHILEVKSSKTNDNRIQCVLGTSFRDHLAARGHSGAPPWEVEQDLIKLSLIAELCETVETCTLLMVDGYSGGGLRWSDIFSDVERFRSTMRTAAISARAGELVAMTRVDALTTTQCDARLIVCRVASRSVSRAV